MMLPLNLKDDANARPRRPGGTRDSQGAGGGGTRQTGRLDGGEGRAGNPASGS